MNIFSKMHLFWCKVSCASLALVLIFSFALAANAQKPTESQSIETPSVSPGLSPTDDTENSGKLTDPSSSAMTDEEVDLDEEIPVASPETSISPELEVNDLIVLASNYHAPEVRPGDRIVLRLPITVNRDAFSDSSRTLSDIRIEPITSNDISKWPFEGSNTSYVRQISTLKLGDRADTVYEFKVSRIAESGSYELNFNIDYVDSRTEVESSLIVSQRRSTVISCTFTIAEFDENINSNKGSSGDLSLELNQLSKADVGDRIVMTLPLKNNTDRDFSELSVTPDISSNLNEFPFVLEGTDYLKKLPMLRSGEEISLGYSFLVADGLEPGIKPVGFTVLFLDDGVMREVKFTLYVDVLVPENSVNTDETDKTPDTDIVSPATTAELTKKGSKDILECKYSLEDEKAVSGKPFRLMLELTNTSENQDLHDVLLTWKGDAGSDNSIVISSINAGETVYQHIDCEDHIDISDQEAYALMMTLKYSSDDGESVESRQTVKVPIDPAIQVALNNEGSPVEASKDLPFAVDLLIANQGNSSVYNVAVEVEGEGITLEKSYFGDEIASGEELHAALSFVASEEGEKEGRVLINYEDEYGKTHTVRQEVRVAVSSADLDAADAETLLSQENGSANGEKPSTITVINGQSAVNKNVLSNPAVYVIICGIIAVGAVALVVYKRNKKQ